MNSAHLFDLVLLSVVIDHRHGGLDKSTCLSASSHLSEDTHTSIRSHNKQVEVHVGWERTE